MKGRAPAISAETIHLRPAHELPGLRAIPLLGRTLAMPRLFANPVKVMFELYREYGEVAAINAGDPSLVFAFGPQYNQQILPHASAFPTAMDFPMPMPEGSALARLNVNLITMNGERHRRQRRLMMPAFQRKVIGTHRDTIVKLVEARLSRWQMGSTINVVHEMIELSMSVMMHCLFGVSQSERAESLGHMGMEFMRQLTSPSVMLAPLNLPFTPYGRFVRFCQRLEGEFLDIIRARRQQAEAGHDVLSILIDTHDEDGDRLSDEELIGQTGLLFVAGHETTAYTLVWVLLMLSQHPEIYANLRDELESELHGDAPTFEKLKSVPLLDGVIKETMRLLPTTAMNFIRRGTETFSLGRYQLPAGSRVVLSPMITHRLPHLYPEPRRFLPERWYRLKPTPYDYLPFGAGPRRCVGAEFAELELRVILALLLQRFRPEPLPETTVDHRVRGIILGTRRGVMMKLCPPQGTTQRTELRGTLRDLVDLR